MNLCTFQRDGNWHNKVALSSEVWNAAMTSGGSLAKVSEEAHGSCCRDVVVGVIRVRERRD